MLMRWHVSTVCPHEQYPATLMLKSNLFLHMKDTHKIHEISSGKDKTLQGSFLQVELPLVTTHAKLLNPLASHKANN